MATDIQERPDVDQPLFDLYDLPEPLQEKLVSLDGDDHISLRELCFCVQQAQKNSELPSFYAAVQAADNEALTASTDVAIEFGLFFPLSDILARQGFTLETYHYWQEADVYDAYGNPQIFFDGYELQDYGISSKEFTQLYLDNPEKLQEMIEAVRDNFTHREMKRWFDALEQADVNVVAELLGGEEETPNENYLKNISLILVGVDNQNRRVDGVSESLAETAGVVRSGIRKDKFLRANFVVEGDHLVIASLGPEIDDRFIKEVRYNQVSPETFATILRLVKIKDQFGLPKYFKKLALIGHGRSEYALDRHEYFSYVNFDDSEAKEGDLALTWRSVRDLRVLLFGCHTVVGGFGVLHLDELEALAAHYGETGDYFASLHSIRSFEMLMTGADFASISANQNAMRELRTEQQAIELARQAMLGDRFRYRKHPYCAEGMPDTPEAMYQHLESIMVGKMEGRFGRFYIRKVRLNGGMPLRYDDQMDYQYEVYNYALMKTERNNHPLLKIRLSEIYASDRTLEEWCEITYPTDIHLMDRFCLPCDATPFAFHAELLSMGIEVFGAKLEQVGEEFCPQYPLKALETFFGE